MTKIEYGTKWVEFKIIPLGGFWAVVVGIVEDRNTHTRKVRIAKGKVKGKVHREGDKLEYILENKLDPISQISRFNIKKKSEWEKIKKLVDEYISKIGQPEQESIIITEKI
ncbi:MAG: hypothetical protein ABIJ92_04935 [Candidatus Aenigmatarchaeota archaeon]